MDLAAMLLKNYRIFDLKKKTIYVLHYDFLLESILVYF